MSTHGRQRNATKYQQEHDAEVVEDHVHWRVEDRQYPAKNDEHPAAHGHSDARVPHGVARGGPRDA